MAVLEKFMTEYAVNPIGIDKQNPIFSWLYSGKNPQKSYRITVSSSVDNALIWDSGIVYSDNACTAVYGGKALNSRTKYNVFCVVTDNNGDSYESCDNWFETSISETEWKGDWVSVHVNFQGGTLLFRKLFDVPTDKKILRARCYVAGVGYNELFINGKKSGNTMLSPSVTEYSKRVCYSVYNLDSDFKSGSNVIGVELGYGWFGSRKLLLQLYIEYSDGTLYEDHTAPGFGWWAGGSATINNSIYGGETYDARLEDVYPNNWSSSEYVPTWENGWMYTIHTAAPNGKLEAEYVEPIRICDEYAEKTRANMGGGVFVTDFGQNLAGWAEITVKGERGAVVTLKFGELIDKNGYVNRLNLRSAACIDKYILKGDGIEKFSPRFTYHGFRYMQTEIEGKAELISCKALHVHTDVKTSGEFSCSDEKLNQLHKNAFITEQNNEHSILTDCPQRDERFGWLNDLGSRLYQTVYNFKMERFFDKFAVDIAHTMRKDGAIADTAPYYTGGIPADPVCIAFLMMPLYEYRYYGNPRVCKDLYTELKAWTDFLLSHSSGYIMDYSYYADWVPPYVDIQSDKLYVSTVYLYWHLKMFSAIAKISGFEKQSKEYLEHANNCAKAINDKYFDEKTFNYVNGTQAENALAVSLEIAPEKFRAKIAENIYNDAVKRNHHCTCGNIGYRHMFYVLGEYGYADEVVKILENPEYPGWGFMLKNGATTVWERWESEMSNEMDSFDHPMFGSYDAFFYAYIGGITVEKDAYACDKVRIKPAFVKSLNHAYCSYDTVRGKIIVSWKRESGKILLHAEIPSTITAKIILGDSENQVVGGVYDYTINK